MIPEPAGFSELSKDEQIRYLQALWDRIAEAPDEVPVPESHLQLVEERIAQHRRSSSKVRSAYEMLDEIARKYR
jgi:putative addiction module component (TIGR02574 family)